MRGKKAKQLRRFIYGKDSKRKRSYFGAYKDKTSRFITCIIADADRILYQRLKRVARNGVSAVRAWEARHAIRRQDALYLLAARAGHRR